MLRINPRMRRSHAPAMFRGTSLGLLSARMTRPSDWAVRDRAVAQQPPQSGRKHQEEAAPSMARRSKEEALEDMFSRVRRNLQDLSADLSSAAAAPKTAPAAREADPGRSGRPVPRRSASAGRKAPPSAPEGYSPSHALTDFERFTTSPNASGPRPGNKEKSPPSPRTHTTQTRSDPQRVGMHNGKRPIRAAKGKQTNTMASCHPPPPPMCWKEETWPPMPPSPTDTSPGRITGPGGGGGYGSSAVLSSGVCAVGLCGRSDGGPHRE